MGTDPGVYSGRTRTRQNVRRHERRHGYRGRCGQVVVGVRTRQAVAVWRRCARSAHVDLTTVRCTLRVRGKVGVEGRYGKVLHRVMYPKTHSNGFEKKKTRSHSFG